MAVQTSRRVTRSPNYPIISLPDAIARTRSLHRSEHTHLVPLEVVAKAIGYGTLNGKSAAVISAMGKYGLLDANGDERRVSALALDILLHEPGEPERVEAVQAAASRPTLFAELLNTYGDNPPSDLSLSATLQKRGFNPNTVAGVLRSFRETMRFVREEVDAAEHSGGEQPRDSPMEMLQTPPNAPYQGAPPSTTFGASQDEDQLVLSFKLVGDAEVRSIFKGRVTQEAIEMFRELLHVSRRAFPKEGEAEQPASRQADDQIPVDQ